MKEIILIAGLLLYVVNYVVGWMLYAGKIRMRKRQHQLLYVSVIVLLIALIPFVNDESGALILAVFRRRIEESLNSRKITNSSHIE